MQQDLNPHSYLTIAEVRFPAVVDWVNHIATIQAAFRVARYVESAHIQNQTLQVAKIADQATMVPRVQSSYKFANAKRTSHFILNAQCLTFKTSDFKSFDAFQSLFLEGFYLVNKILNISKTQRMGLRFLDRVVPAKGQRLQNYLAPAELQVFEKLGGASVFAQTEIFHQIEGIQLLHRVKICQYSGLELPQDIDPADMAFKANLITHTGPSIFIDSDGYIEKKQTLSFEKIKQSLSGIYQVIHHANQASLR